jgi:hypothetical protein
VDAREHNRPKHIIGTIVMARDHVRNECRFIGMSNFLPDFSGIRYGHFSRIDTGKKTQWK